MKNEEKKNWRQHAERLVAARKNVPYFYERQEKEGYRNALNMAIELVWEMLEELEKSE